MSALREINRYLRGKDPDRTVEFVKFGITQQAVGTHNDPILSAALLD